LCAKNLITIKVAALFDLNKTETLGLTDAKNKETITIFSPKIDEIKYNNGVVLFPFKGMLYVQWKTSSIDEGVDNTQVFYSRSNGKDLQPMKYKGKYKRIGHNYPKSVTWNGYLYVSYATNKDHVELTRIPISSF